MCSLKKQFKKKLKTAAPAPEYIKEFIAPSKFTAEMYSYCYGDEVPVAAGTLPPIPNPDGRLRRSSTSQALSSQALVPTMPRENQLMQELYLRKMAMMNAMEENVGPGGGLANLKIFKKDGKTTPAASAPPLPALPAPVEAPKALPAPDVSGSAPPSSAPTPAAPPSAPGPPGPPSAPAPTAEAVLEALRNRELAKPKAKSKAKAKANAKNKAATAKGKPGKSTAKPASAKSTAKPSSAKSTDLGKRWQEHTPFQTRPPLPPPCSGTIWYRAGKIQCSSSDAFRVFLKTGDRCDRPSANRHLFLCKNSLPIYIYIYYIIFI